MNIENTVWECFLKAIDRFNASGDPQSLLCPRCENPKTKTEKAAASERAIAHRLAFYLESEMRRVGLVGDFGPITVDCEYNRHLVDGKALATGVQEEVQAIVKKARQKELEADEDGFYVFSIAPDILVHQRKTDANNLLVIEVKKRSNRETEKYDLLKLELFTKSKADKMGYAYKFGAWVVAEDEWQAEAQPSRIGITAIEEIVQSRQILLQEQSQGWLEKRLSEWLYPREKSVAEFAFPRGFHITKPWIKILRNFLLMVLIGFVFSTVNQTLEIWAFGVGLFITFCQSLAQMWANGAAFRVLLNNGIKIPMYAAYPITFLELSRTLFKSSIIQLPLFITYTMSCAILITYLTATPIVFGIIIGFKAGLLVFASRFITTALAFSACTNDSTRFRVRNITLVVVFIVCVCLFVFLGGAGLFVPDTLVAWLLWLAALLDAYALFRIYGWFYHANCFDLMSFPRR